MWMPPPSERSRAGQRTRHCRLSPAIGRDRLAVVARTVAHGIASTAAVPVRWSATENVVWRTPVPGRGHSSPVIVGDRVFLTTAEDKAQVQSVLAFDRGSGKQLWKIDVSRGGFPRRHSSSRTHTPRRPLPATASVCWSRSSITKPSGHGSCRSTANKCGKRRSGHSILNRMNMAMPLRRFSTAGP